MIFLRTLAVLLAIEIALSQDLGISEQKRKFDALLKQFGFSSSIPSSVVKRPEPSLQSSDLRQTDSRKQPTLNNRAPFFSSGNTGRQTTTEQNIPTVSRQTFSFNFEQPSGQFGEAVQLNRIPVKQSSFTRQNQFRDEVNLISPLAQNSDTSISQQRISNPSPPRQNSNPPTFESGNSHSVDIDAIAQSFGFSFALTGKGRESPNLSQTVTPINQQQFTSNTNSQNQQFSTASNRLQLSPNQSNNVNTRGQLLSSQQATASKRPQLPSQPANARNQQLLQPFTAFARGTQLSSQQATAVASGPLTQQQIPGVGRGQQLASQLATADARDPQQPLGRGRTSNLPQPSSRESILQNLMRIAGSPGTDETSSQQPSGQTPPGSGSLLTSTTRVSSPSFRGPTLTRPSKDSGLLRQEILDQRRGFTVKNRARQQSNRQESVEPANNFVPQPIFQRQPNPAAQPAKPSPLTTTPRRPSFPSLRRPSSRQQSRTPAEQIESSLDDKSSGRLGRPVPNFFTQDFRVENTPLKKSEEVKEELQQEKILFEAQNEIEVNSPRPQKPSMNRDPVQKFIDAHSTFSDNELRQKEPKTTTVKLLGRNNKKSSKIVISKGASSNRKEEDILKCSKLCDHLIFEVYELLGGRICKCQ